MTVSDPEDSPGPRRSRAPAARVARGLRDLSAEPASRVSRLLEAMRSVGTGLELDSTLDRIAGTAAGLTGACHAVIGVLEENGEEGGEEGTGGGLSAFAAYGVPDEVVRRVGRRPGDLAGLLGALVHHPEPAPAGHRPGRPPMRTYLGVPIRVRGELLGHLHLTGKRGGTGFDDDDLHMVRVLAAEAGIAIGNARLYEAARRRERWIDGSVAVTTALLSGGEADDALWIVAEQARRLAGASAGIVLLPTGDGGLEIAAVSSDRPSGRPGLVVPPESPVARRLLAGEAVFTADAAADPRMTTGAVREYGPVMMLPLRSGGRVLGALVVPRAPGDRRFGAAERALATRFAAQAALALMMAETQRDRERLAVYEDRDRIARDLHDLVIQRLFATGMMLESAQRGSVVPAVREGVEKAVHELDVTIQEIRTTVFALQQGPAGAPSDLRTRVRREVGTAAVPLGFTPSLRFVGPVGTRVGELTGKNLVAALREALSNAFRHARAHRIEVVVDATARLPDGTEAVRLTVADDGVGIPAGGRRSGLRNLARRAESLGGSSRCGPGIGEDGGGTTVVWEAPL